MSGLEIDPSYWEPPDYPEEEAWIKRCEANQRAHCGWCNAYVSNEQAAKSWKKGPTAWGDCDDGPTCEPGKGCNRKAPDA